MQSNSPKHQSEKHSRAKASTKLNGQNKPPWDWACRKISILKIEQNKLHMGLTSNTNEKSQKRSQQDSMNTEAQPKRLDITEPGPDLHLRTC
jgi:hypothetical protein